MSAVSLPPKVLFCNLLHKYEVFTRRKILHYPPYRIGIELTNKCNINCIHCIKKSSYKLGEMKFEDFKTIFAEFPYAISVSLNGVGEPLLHPQFFDVVRHIKSVRPHLITTIFSNGILINESMCYEFIKSGLSKIHISLDAASSETYKKVRGVDKFEHILSNIRMLVELKRKLNSKTPLIGINFLLMKENEGELVRFIGLAKELGVDYICEIDTFLFNFGDWKLRELRGMDSYMSELEAGRQELKKIGVRCIYYPPLKPKSFNCNRFWDEVRVSFNGDITLGCCTFCRAI